MRCLTRGRAGVPGTQTIRLIFDRPQRLRRIWLVFEETEAFRTQEFVLRWSSQVGQPFPETVRQQWNFSSPGGVREIENYAVDLFDVEVLELVIVPDKSGREARASLEKFELMKGRQAGDVTIPTPGVTLANLHPSPLSRSRTGISRVCGQFRFPASNKHAATRKQTRLNDALQSPRSYLLGFSFYSQRSD